MNSFQTCRNTADAVPLYLPQQLYLKPAARITISIQLPNVKKLDKSISHWEIMEKLRLAIRPDEFSVIKVTKTTLEFVRFEAEIDNRSRLDRVVSKLDNNSIKLKEIPDLIRVKASEVKSDFPTRHKWDSFFQEARDMDEMKPGQRPDTIHLSNLPMKWFTPHHLKDDDDATPSEKMFYRIFEKFGPIRYVDIPICDPYRKKMKDAISGLKSHPSNEKELFEGYVQFKDYMGFTKTMDALKGMKLLYKEDDEAFSVNIKVDFDRTKHLSDASIRRREIIRDRLVRKQRENEEKDRNELNEKKKREQTERQNVLNSKTEKDKRRREREQKRKAKILEKLKINGCDEINDKIAKEEKKLLKAQRKLEAIRLVEELFKRIKDKKDEYGVNVKTRTSNGTDELKRLKNMSELEVLNQRHKLHNAIEGRVVLKSILSDQKRPRSRSSSTSDSSNSEKKPRRLSSSIEIVPQDGLLYDPNWYGYPSYPMYPPPPQVRGSFHMYPGRSRGYSMPGPSRGRYNFSRSNRGFNKSRYRGRYRGPQSYAPELEDEYVKYFSKFLNDHVDRSHKNRSRSRDRHRSYTRTRSRSSSRRRSYSRTRSRSYTPESRSRRTRSRSKSAKRGRSRSPSRFTPPIHKSKSRSRSKSVDSSKFVSHSEMRTSARSKSWSLPKSGRGGERRSWSKSPGSNGVNKK